MSAGPTRCRWRLAASSTSRLPGAIAWWRSPEGDYHIAGALGLYMLMSIACSDWYEDARPAEGAAARVVVPRQRRGRRPPVLATGGNALPPRERGIAGVGAGVLTPAPHGPYSTVRKGPVAPVDVCGVSFVDGDAPQLHLASDVATTHVPDGKPHGVLATRLLV